MSCCAFEASCVISVGEASVTLVWAELLVGWKGDHGRATCDMGACEGDLGGGVFCVGNIGVAVELVSL